MNEITTAHILVTSLCDRDCPYCCNKQYDLNDIPYITDEELKKMKHIYLTGGEPFEYSNPCEIARELKFRYSNIDSVIVYTNAFELARYLGMGGLVYGIDGVTVSIKNIMDRAYFNAYVFNDGKLNSIPSNRLYVFPGFEDVKCPEGWQKIKREWQEKFVPAPNCIFRRL